MNYSGNMPDWHQYNSAQPGINDVTSTNQNTNSGHLAFISSISPTSINGLNLSTDGIEKHQNDPNYNSRHFQSLGNISGVPNGTESNPLAPMVQMQNCISHYGPSGARNPMEPLNGSIDPRNNSIPPLNEELGYRNNQVPLNGPVAHLGGPNVPVNGPTNSIGSRNNSIGTVPPGRQGPPPSFIPCKGFCCNPDPNVSYQQWEKYGHYQANQYRDNVRAAGYTADNRRYGGDLNFRKDAYENKEVLAPMMSNVDHRRNFPDYTKYRKESVISRPYPPSSGMLQNYPVQNYNYTGEYQKYPYGIKEYSKMGSVGLPNPGILKHQEQTFYAQQKYNNKQVQYQNGGMVPKLPTTANSNVIPPAQTSYFNSQFPRNMSNELPRDCQETAESANRMQSTPIHGTHSRYQTYQQKIAMQRFSMENHLREFTRIPGYQSHPKYKECILRYRELLKLQQSVEYQNTIQQTPRVETPVNSTVPPINLQFDQNGVLINSNYLTDGFQRLQQTLNPNPSSENSDKQEKELALNVVNPDIQHTLQLNSSQSKDSTVRAENLQNQEQHIMQKDLDQSQFQLQKDESDNFNSESPSGTIHTKISKEFADKPELDVRQFLANWDESEDEDGTNPNLSNVVLNDSMPVVVVDYENVNLSAETINHSKQESVCATEVTFDAQNKSKDSVPQECLTISYSASENIDASKISHGDTTANIIKPGGVIHCISNGPNDIPTIHIVDNLEISNILEVPSESAAKVLEQEQSIQFFEQNSEASTSPSENNILTSEKCKISLENVPKKECTRQEPAEVIKENQTEVPINNREHNVNSSQNSNLKKQSSFTSEESHNPDDISLPDLPTSECTPISTTLNTPIQSDNEESSEQVEDLTISTNPIEIIQNSPVISFTQSPVKVEPYQQLDNREIDKHKLHSSDFNFEENHSKDNTNRKMNEDLNLDNFDLSANLSKSESTGLNRNRQEKSSDLPGTSKEISANNESEATSLSLKSTEYDITENEKLTTIQSTKIVSQKNNSVKIIADKTGHFVDSISMKVPKIIEDRVIKEVNILERNKNVISLNDKPKKYNSLNNEQKFDESSKTTTSADTKIYSERERLKSLKEYRRIKTKQSSVNEPENKKKQLEIISKNKHDSLSKLSNSKSGEKCQLSQKSSQSPHHDQSFAKHTICLKEEPDSDRKQGFSRSFVTKNMNTDFEIQVTNVNLKIKDNNDIRKQLLTLREKNTESATDGIKIEINLSCADHTGEKSLNKEEKYDMILPDVKTSSSTIECRGNQNNRKEIETEETTDNKTENEANPVSSTKRQKTEDNDLFKKFEHKSIIHDKEESKMDDYHVFDSKVLDSKNKFMEANNQWKNTFHNQIADKILLKESDKSATKNNTEPARDVSNTFDDSNIKEGHATDTTEHMTVLASVKNFPDISLSKQLKSKQIHKNDVPESTSHFSLDTSMAPSNSCIASTCNVSSSSANTMDINVEGLDYENPLKLDFDHFDIEPNENTDDKEKEADKQRGLQMECLNDEDIYKGISGFVNPAFTSIDNSQNLDAVPVYTTKDGKITYSPNPRFTYRALIMEARKREGYPTVRKSHKNNYHDYTNSKKWFKEAHNLSNFRRKSSQSSETKTSYDLTLKQADKLNEKNVDNRKNHNYRVKNKNVTFLEYYNDGANKKYGIEDEEDESIIFNNKNFDSDFKHHERKQYDKSVSSFNVAHHKNKVSSDADHIKKNGMSFTSEAELLDKRNKDTLDFYESYRPQNTEENISDIKDLGFHDIDAFSEEINDSKSENFVTANESFTIYDNCKDMPQNLCFDENEELQKITYPNEEQKSMAPDEAENKFEHKFADKCEDKFEDRSEDKFEGRSEDKFEENEYENISEEKSKNKYDDISEEKSKNEYDDIFEEKSKNEYDDISEEKSKNEYEDISEEKSKNEYKDISEEKSKNESEDISEEKSKSEPEENREEKSGESCENKCEENFEDKSKENWEDKSEEKSEKKNINKEVLLNDLKSPEVPIPNSDLKQKSAEKEINENGLIERSLIISNDEKENTEIPKLFDSAKADDIDDELEFTIPKIDKHADKCDCSSKVEDNIELNDKPPKLYKEVNNTEKFEDPPNLNIFDEEVATSVRQDSQDSQLQEENPVISNEPENNSELNANPTNESNAEKQIEKAEYNNSNKDLAAGNETALDQPFIEKMSTTTENIPKNTAKRDIDVNNQKNDQLAEMEKQTENNTEIIESSNINFLETADLNSTSNIVDDLNDKKEHINETIGNNDSCITKMFKYKDIIRNDERDEVDFSDNKNMPHLHRHEVINEHGQEIISTKVQEEFNSTSQNTNYSESMYAGIQTLKDEPIDLSLEHNSSSALNDQITEETEQSNTNIPVSESEIFPPDETLHQNRTDINSSVKEDKNDRNEELLVNKTLNTESNKEYVDTNCYVTTCEIDAEKKSVEVTEESENQQNSSIKVVPKIVIKKVEMSPKITADTDNTKKSKSGLKQSLYPKIPKMIIRNASSRPGTPTIKEIAGNNSTKIHETDHIFEVKSESLKEENNCTQNLPESTRTKRENKIPKMKIRLGSKSPKRVADSNNDGTSSVKHKDSKRSMEKVKYKKLRTESMEKEDITRENVTHNYHNNRDEHSHRSASHDAEQKKEKLPKLKLRKHETEKSSGSETRRRSSSSGSDIPNKKYKKSEREEPMQSTKLDNSVGNDNSSREREIRKNSLLCISEKIPKVIIKRSSATSEFKCELSKDRKNAIVKSAKWQPEVKLQRCQIIDRMVKDFKKLRSSLCNKSLTDPNSVSRYKMEDIYESEDQIHDSYRLSRSNSTSNLSPVKRKQRRMSDYEYRRCKDLETEQYIDVETVSQSKIDSSKDHSSERKSSNYKQNQKNLSDATHVASVEKGKEQQIENDKNTKETVHTSKDASLKQKVNDISDLPSKLKETFKSKNNTKLITHELSFDQFHPNKSIEDEIKINENKFMSNINQKFFNDSFEDEEIDDRVKERLGKSINPSDIEENANQEDDVELLKSGDRMVFNDNAVIKIDSSDDSQTTIEILPASPDISQNELHSCELDDGESERVYLGDAIPTQFELELEITDNSNVDPLDISMPKLKEMTHYSADLKSTEKYKSEVTSKESPSKIPSKRKHSIDSKSDNISCGTDSIIDQSQSISELEVESMDIFEAVEKEASNTKRWHNDPLIKEVLAAKETLKKFLTKSSSESRLKYKARLKTAAEKKQGLSFDLKSHVDTSSSETKHIKHIDDRPFDRNLEHKTGNQTKTDEEKSEKMHSKHDKSSSIGKKMKSKSVSMSSENPCSTYSFAHSRNDPSVMNDFTISLKASKCLNKSATGHVQNLRKSSSEPVENNETKNKGIPYKIPKISRSRDEHINAGEAKEVKTKEDNMPVLEPEVTLNFDPSSDRDNSRSPPVITNQDSIDVEDTKASEEKLIASDDKFEKDEKDVDKKSEMTLADIVSQLAYHEKATIRHRRYCTLCEKWFPTTSRHRRHLAGYQHRHIELTQRRTIHALFMLFTGKPCPRLLPANIVRSDCCIGELTPLQIAVQDVTKGTKQTEQHPWKSNDIDK